MRFAEVRTDTVHLRSDWRRMGLDWAAIVQRLGTGLDDAVSVAFDFIRDVKLSLPGPPVRKGGASGPTPGMEGEPVLHVDTGSLKGSIRKYGHGKQLTARTRVLKAGIGFDRRTRAGRDYAFAHEFGTRRWHATGRGPVPPRPFMRPGFAVLRRLTETAVREAFQGLPLDRQVLLAGLVIDRPLLGAFARDR